MSAKLKPIRDNRDQPPEGAAWPPYVTQICPEWLWPLLLIGKMHEEVEEVREDPSNPEEYADVLELLYAVAESNGVSREAIEHARIKKLGTAGAFTERKVLVRDV